MSIKEIYYQKHYFRYQYSDEFHENIFNVDDVLDYLAMDFDINFVMNTKDEYWPLDDFEDYKYKPREFRVMGVQTRQILMDVIRERVRGVKPQFKVLIKFLENIN